MLDRRASLRRTILIAVIGGGLVFVQSTTRSQQFQPSNEQSPIGTNLAAIADYSTELPFMDAFKSAREWITQCVSSDPGCQGEWDTGESHLLDLDADGWVRRLPGAWESPKFTRVTTIMYRDIPNLYPWGEYVVLYEGEGTLEYGLAATKIEAESRPGRDVIHVESWRSQGIQLTISQTDPRGVGNYIRNISVVPVAYEHRFRTEIFSPEFIENVEPYRALRFMWWMETNDTTQEHWWQRPQPSHASYAWKGAPVETMVALGNQTGADPWFTMPHRATDDYMRQFAELVKRTLHPTLKVYVEFSNEVWNWIYPQSQHALQQGRARWGSHHADAHMQWYGMRSAQMCDIWKNVFSDARDQVVCVFATQGPWFGLERPALNCPLWVAEGNAPCHEHQFDVYAIAAYFGNSIGSPNYENTIATWAAQGEWGISKAFQELEFGNVLAANIADSLPNIDNMFEYHAGVANGVGMELAAYEGGQHLVANGSALENQSVTDFLIELNRRPEMGRMYTKLLDEWRDSGGRLFMHFNDVGKPGKFGSFGVRENLQQSSTPKYDAVMNFIRTDPCWWSDCRVGSRPPPVVRCSNPLP